MSEKKISDGGPAFPVKKWREEGHYEGLSIRDWFAGMALQGMVANPSIGSLETDQFASDAYLYADAMIARRTM